MSQLPPTATEPRLSPFDPAAWAATAIQEPAIALIDISNHLGVLLARSTQREPDRFRMHAVRWTRIPQRWRLSAMRLRSHFWRVRLPDEWLFEQVDLTRSNGLHVARIADGLLLPRPSAVEHAIRPLTAAQYRRLEDAPGRALHAMVLELFRDVSGLHIHRRSIIAPAGYACAAPPSAFRVFNG